MSITVDEKFESRYNTTGLNPSAELRVTLYGDNRETDTDAAARVALRAWGPATFDIYGDGTAILYQNEMAISIVGDLMWEGVISYGIYLFQPSFTFDTTGCTRHTTQSRATRSFAPPGKVPPNHHGAIGVDSHHNVTGVDTVVPTYNFQETYFYPDAYMTGDRRRTFAVLTGCYNADWFKGFAPGECLFQGAVGGKRGLDSWEVTFKFSAAPNIEDVTIGDIVVGSVGGWEYVWVEYVDEEQALPKGTAKKPKAVHVEQLYRPGPADLSLLGIGV